MQTQHIHLTWPIENVLLLVLAMYCMPMESSASSLVQAMDACELLSIVFTPLHAFRRSGLRVRPLLRHAFQPQQPHGKAHSRQQQAQQQQQQQQGNAARLSQDQASDQSSQTKDQPVDSITQSEQGASQTTDSQKPDQAAIEASGESQRPDADLQTDQTETPVSERQGKASGRSQKSKRTKKDYAAWAGATAETRAIASAQLQSNADGAEASEPTQTGQPNTPGLDNTLLRLPSSGRLPQSAYAAVLVFEDHHVLHGVLAV